MVLFIFLRQAVGFTHLPTLHGFSVDCSVGNWLVSSQIILYQQETTVHQSSPKLPKQYTRGRHTGKIWCIPAVPDSLCVHRSAPLAMCSQQAFISLPVWIQSGLCKKAGGVVATACSSNQAHTPYAAGEEIVDRHDSSFALAPEGPFRKRDIRSRLLAQEIGTPWYMACVHRGIISASGKGYLWRKRPQIKIVLGLVCKKS